MALVEYPLDPCLPAEEAAPTDERRGLTRGERLNTAACVLNRDGIVVRANSAMAALFHKSPSDLTGTSFQYLLKKAGCPMAQTLSDADTQTLWQPRELQINDRWYEETVQMLWDDQGRATGSALVLTDVTRRKRREEERERALRLQTQRADVMQALVDASSEGILSVDVEERIAFANEAAGRLIGCAPSELVGQRVRGLILDADDEGGGDGERSPARFTLQGGGARLGKPALLRTCADQTVPIEYDCVPLRVGRMVRGAALTFRAVEEKRKLQEQLHQSQKMEAVGRLASGAAHDFNNLLTVIIGYGELALAKLAPDDPLTGIIEEIRNSGERAAMLTRQLLAFSRKQVILPTVIDLNELLANVGKMLRRLIGEDVELIVEEERPLGRIKADVSQIEQVIMNLVVNARDAMPHGGKLTVKTRNVAVGPGAALPAGEYVALSVADTGCGMDAATRARIFEPFFTTKGPDKGTGLGLAMVRDVVTGCGGHVDVASELGRGSTFTILFPRDQTPPTAKQSSPGLSAQSGTETVLLVEDEECVRALSRRVLVSRGYVVLEARDGNEALAICERHLHDIHLVVTDVVMPNLSGRQLVERLLPLRPGMKVLYLSGYSDEAIKVHGTLDPDAPLLEKPFSPEALIHAVRKVLDG